MTGPGGGGVSLLAASTMSVSPTRRKPRLLASSRNRNASSQVTPTRWIVTLPCTEESVTRLRPQILASASSTSERLASRRSRLSFCACCGVPWLTTVMPIPATTGAAGALAAAGGAPAGAAGAPADVASRAATTLAPAWTTS